MYNAAKTERKHKYTFDSDLRRLPVTFVLLFMLFSCFFPESWTWLHTFSLNHPGDPFFKSVATQGLKTTGLMYSIDLVEVILKQFFNNKMLCIETILLGNGHCHLDWHHFGFFYLFIRAVGRTCGHSHKMRKGNAKTVFLSFLPL